MSYILEALKKSDHQRKQGNVPDLQTIHMPSAVESADNRWLYLVIVVLLVCLAFVVGWLQPWKTPAMVVSQPQPMVSAPEKDQLAITQYEPTQALNNQPGLASDVEAEPLQVEQMLNQSREMTEQMAAIDAAPSLEIEAVPHLSEMPDLVQQAIPSMSFAGHVYSSDISQRSVIINGHSMSEGEMLIKGLVVEQITSDGIIFAYQGQLFRMEILQDWSFD